MRICTRISTNRIIEMQSDAPAGTLIKNAVIAGIPESDVIEEVVSLPEYKIRVAAQSKTVDELNAEVIAKIIAIDATIIRQLSDIAAGVGDIASGPDNKTPRQRLTEKRAQMDALRGQLK